MASWKNWDIRRVFPNYPKESIDQSIQKLINEGKILHVAQQPSYTIKTAADGKKTCHLFPLSIQRPNTYNTTPKRKDKKRPNLQSRSSARLISQLRTKKPRLENNDQDGSPQPSPSPPAEDEESYKDLTLSNLLKGESALYVPWTTWGKDVTKSAVNTKVITPQSLNGFFGDDNTRDSGIQSPGSSGNESGQTQSVTAEYLNGEWGPTEIEEEVEIVSEEAKSAESRVIDVVDIASSSSEEEEDELSLNSQYPDLDIEEVTPIDRGDENEMRIAADNVLAIYSEEEEEDDTEGDPDWEEFPEDAIELIEDFYGLASINN